MARYHRDFLVPYLQNICALHFAQERINQRYSVLENSEHNLVKGKHNPRPVAPEYTGFVTGGTVILVVLGVFLAFFGIMGTVVIISNITKGYIEFNFGIIFCVVFIAALGFACILGAIKGVVDRKQEYEDDYRRYTAALAKYEKIEKANADARNNLPAVRREKQQCTQEFQRTDYLLKRVYDANVIPNRYRNIYAAVYLYDWFSSSGADDLDHALSMFVLEEIKERLDVIIANQSEMILNQRIQIANQQRTLAQQQSYENMMRSKLSQIQATQEERLKYAKMIECNTAATAYFVAADYIRRI